MSAAELRQLNARELRLALETLVDEPTRVFNCGEYRDKLVAAGDRLLFQEKLCVFDTLSSPTA